MRTLLLLFSVVLFLCSCEKDCYNPPQPIIFEFVDESGNNLIENGELTNMTVQEDMGNGNFTGVELTKTNDHKVILEKVGAFDGERPYKFFSNINVFDFSIKSSRFTAGCEGYQIKSIVFKNIQVTDEKVYYKIILKP
ncbi:MAG: hypothetical protein LBE92_03425 [Chryseobacterium sp.]|jgi:hypothetical protein|uniref:hypothetical protein n=1 Tax=Chryseobacterium sp. TaxID=1871047 RepID=UPI00281CCF28|nr:hypothetical protein [Chryseobacterium sp.]MDR2235151.1 hypothetical protein [Chryseobacterium sp.]